MLSLGEGGGLRTESLVGSDGGGHPDISIVGRVANLRVISPVGDGGTGCESQDGGNGGESELHFDLSC